MFLIFPFAPFGEPTFRSFAQSFLYRRECFLIFRRATRTKLMAKGPSEMLIESVKMELPDTKTIQVKWPEGYECDFKTGQFITLFWPDTTNYKRAYSLSSCALDRGSF